MPWYAAHAVLLVVFRDGNQDRFPVWENIYLVNAGSIEEGFSAAKFIALQAMGDDDPTFTWSGRPARWEFKGIRMLIRCDSDDGDELVSGAEATYLQMEFKRSTDLEDFIAGDRSVNVDIDP